MRATLFCTPVADVRTQLADLLGKRAVSGDSIGAESADCGALDTTGRTVIVTLPANHVCETIAALGRAEIAGVNAVFSELI